MTLNRPAAQVTHLLKAAEVAAEQINMDPSTSRYWFRAKSHGWGWGFPSSWQGWVFFVLWIAALSAGAAWLAPHGVLLMIGFILLMAVAFVAVCYAKGEPPAWR